MAEPRNEPSRYERVKEILNEAQGDRIPDYQGYRAFWQSIETFEQAVLYGQRMIAPPEPGDVPDTHAAEASEEACCGHTPPPPGPDSTNGPAVSAVTFWPTDGAGTANCWPSGGSGGSGSSGSGQKRSQRSGIIKGLRGEYPFDDTIFPPLLWNAARRVTESEIALIAAWIDAGCPATDEPEAPVAATVIVRSNDVTALACGDLAHQVSQQITNQDAMQKQGLHVRKEVGCLSADELHRLREAIACMYQYNAHWLDNRSFDFWARIHTNSCQHGWEQFLPWHRLYLYFFEQMLQDYDATIALPYWSWSDYAEENKGTYQTKQLDIGRIPEAYHCWLDRIGAERLKQSGLFSEAELARLEHLSNSGTTYNSGHRFLRAAEIDYTLIKDPSTGQAAWGPQTRAIYNELRRANPLWFPNRWPGSTGTATHYPTPADIQDILNVGAWPDFGGGPESDHHFGALEEVHNGMHNFAGGGNPNYPSPAALGIGNPDPQNPENPPMGWMTDNRVTAFDPIFWAHHSNVDRLWARWQELHPNINPDDLDGALPPWSLTVKDTLSIKKLGYEYMRDSYHYATRDGVALTRFNSDKAGVRSWVLDTHRKADIRLHRVRRGNLLNASIRIFLNDPGATIDTPTENNPHYVGQVMTFHGTCYGGPGHCDLPLPRTRRFDQRRIHHDEPRNFRLDATAAVQRMITQGEDDLSVHLVVVGLDGEPMNDAFFIDGVSLNFMD